MLIKAHAKINLSLDVKSLREDGYHDLETIMLPLLLHDSIEIVILPPTSYDDYVTCDDYSITVTKYNLCHKMIDAARKKRGFKQHFYISIHKNIFLQAGLGGGSADAAATLIGIIKLLKIKTNIDELVDIALSVGSDVPWGILSKPCLVKRKGEVLEPFEALHDFFVLLVKPTKGLSTQVVFQKGEEDGFSIHGDIEKVKHDFLAGDFKNLSKSVFNSLEEPAIKLLPEIQDIKTSLLNDGFDVVLMSGAGSAVFALTKNMHLAKHGERVYNDKGYQVELTRMI